MTVVLPPPISGATKLYTPTKPETTATFCTPPYGALAAAAASLIGAAVFNGRAIGMALSRPAAQPG